ncbi:anthrone oxygenase family protein [Streptomyces lavendulae]|uniref:anthrone oxygenase family protein n=1 Tax=Streptomyces lavendulae TaxID=1914 RepID=UPI00368C70AD
METERSRPRGGGHGGRARAGAAGFLLGLATVLVGLMAGLFFAFDVSVMPGLAASDDRTYVTAMQHFNAAIDGNGLFGTVFLLALLAAAASALVEFRGGRRTVALWAGAAAAAYLVVLVITFTVNIPLNNELAAVGDAAKATAFPVLDKFRGTWVTTNVIRTLLCTAALTALARALLLHGRATADHGQRTGAGGPG